MHLIGIELIDCKNTIFKNLKKKGDKLSNGKIFNGWYPFCGYEKNETPPSFDDDNITYLVPQRFYKSNNTDKFISVSCIVGKNGSGKSTLLDIYYRIITNISYSILQLDPLVEKDTLEYSFGFSANLYFSTIAESIIDDKTPVENIGYIKINHNGHDYIKFPRGKEKCICDINEEKKEIIRNDNCDIATVSVFKDFFYSVVTNYSMYSFNPEDYEKNDYYVYNIFHKNDAYITPIVLLPFRNESGDIDIENERGLARQRIIALQAYLNNHYEKPISMIPDRKVSQVSYTFINDYISNKKRNIEKLVKNFLNAVECSGIRIKSVNSNSFFELLKTVWIEKLETKYNVKIDEKIKSKKIKEALIFYLAYKTLKTCEYYKLYLNEFLYNKEEESFSIIIDKLCNNSTFLTLKIRQCIRFIIHPLPVEKVLGENIIPIENILTEKNKNEETVDDYLINLPPAIFKTDLLFQINDGSPYYMSSLSSGELQLINSYSYVLYHLKNLECDKSSISGKGNVIYPNYKNIEIIFDEAELYMHPEYQRQFIFSLINAINNCNFQNIQQIHILIATHSPYMLSDVPAQNILMLEEGEIRRKSFTENQTFGANIYDLLKTQFFMTSAIGEYAKQTINKLCSNNFDSEEELNIMLERVDFIGDSYLKNSINYLIKKRKLSKEEY